MDPKEEMEDEIGIEETDPTDFGGPSHEEAAFRVSEEIFGRDFESNIIDDFEDLVSRSEE